MIFGNHHSELAIPCHRADIKIWRECWQGTETTTLWKIPPGHWEVQPVSERWRELQWEGSTAFLLLCLFCMAPKLPGTLQLIHSTVSAALHCVWFLHVVDIGSELLSCNRTAKLNGLRLQKQFGFPEWLSNTVQHGESRDRIEDLVWRMSEILAGADLHYGFQQIPSRKNSSKWFKWFGTIGTLAVAPNVSDTDPHSTNYDLMML